VTDCDEAIPVLTTEFVAFGLIGSIFIIIDA